MGFHRSHRQVITPWNSSSVVGAVLREIGYDEVTTEQIARVSPGRKQLQDMALECAVDATLLLKQKVQLAEAIYIGCDKGHRKDIDHFAKILSFYDQQKKRVSSHLLDLNGSGSSSLAAAESIHLSLKTKLGESVVHLAGQTTDSGGGGVLDSLREKLSMFDRVDPDLYLTAPCTLHTLQRCLNNAFVSMIGEGGLGRRNALQLTHACYDLQKCFAGRELGIVFEAGMRQAMMNDRSEDNVHPQLQVAPSKRMQKAVLTRWWYVTCAMSHLSKHWRQWLSFSKACINATKADSKVNKIASCIWSLMQEPEIKVDIEFICGFARYYFHTHFQWLQGYDQYADDYGYRSRNMLERVFHMHQEFQALPDALETHPSFEPWRSELSKLASESSQSSIEEGVEGELEVLLTAEELNEAEELLASTENLHDPPLQSKSRNSCTVDEARAKALIFFDTFQRTFIKHHSSWSSTNLIICALAGEQQTATALANWIINDIIPEQSIVSLVEHEADFCLQEYITYVSGYADRVSLLESPIIHYHKEAIEFLATGVYVFGDTHEPSVLLFRRFAEERILPLMSSTHRVEGMIREASLCATTGRSEGVRSAIAITRNLFTQSVARRTIPLKTIPSDVKRPPRGAARSKALLDEMDDLIHGIEQIEVSKKDRDAIKKSFKEEGLLDKQQRLEKKRLQFTNAKDKKTNKLMKQSGVDMTSSVAGEIAFASFNKSHRELLIGELSARGITPPKTDWNTLRGLLGKSFEPLTDEVKEVALSLGIS